MQCASQAKTTSKLCASIRKQNEENTKEKKARLYGEARGHKNQDVFNYNFSNIITFQLAIHFHQPYLIRLFDYQMGPTVKLRLNELQIKLYNVRVYGNELCVCANGKSHIVSSISGKEKK